MGGCVLWCSSTLPHSPSQEYVQMKVDLLWDRHIPGTRFPLHLIWSGKSMYHHMVCCVHIWCCLHVQCRCVCCFECRCVCCFECRCVCVGVCVCVASSVGVVTIIVI